MKVYADFECPYCAWARAQAAAARAGLLPALPGLAPSTRAPGRPRRPSRRPRNQGAFWAMHDSVYADQGGTRTRTCGRGRSELGLDLDRFVADWRGLEGRRSSASRRDFNTGIRAGVAATPTLFMPDGEAYLRPPGPVGVGAADRPLSRPGSFTTVTKNSSIWRTTSMNRSKSTGLVT